MLDTIAIILAVIAAAGGIAKAVHEYYTADRDQQNIVNNNYGTPQDQQPSNLESIVMEEMKHGASPREIDIKINVSRPKDKEKESK